MTTMHGMQQRRPVGSHMQLIGASEKGEATVDGEKQNTTFKMALQIFFYAIAAAGFGMSIAALAEGGKTEHDLTVHCEHIEHCNTVQCAYDHSFCTECGMGPDPEDSANEVQFIVDPKNNTQCVKECDKDSDCKEHSCGYADGSNKLESTCTECNVGYVLHDGKCTHCANGCASCTIDDENAVSSTTTCNSCMDGYYWDEENEVCVDCANGQYACKTCKLLHLDNDATQVSCTSCPVDIQEHHFSSPTQYMTCSSPTPTPTA